MAQRMLQRRGTASQWTAANTILGSGEIGFETDTNQFKIGDGVTAWNSIPYFKNFADPGYVKESRIGQQNGVASLDADGGIPVAQLRNLIDNAPDTLNTLNEIADALDVLDGQILSVVGETIATEVTNRNDAIEAAIEAEVIARGGAIENAINDEVVDRDAAIATAKQQAESTAQGYVDTHSSATTNIHGISNTADLVTDTDLTNGLSEKQDKVSGVSDTEIGYLDGVTSAIQTQIDGKADTSHTHDISEVTSLQTALDSKLNLSGGTMTGKITLDGDPSSALHATTKQYVDNTASGIVAKPQVLGATTTNIDATYDNGTAGVGATLTHNTNGAFPSSAGGASGWAVGKGILVKNQTNKAQNGRYYISNMGSASTPYVLTRCSYCDEASEIPGAYIFVQDGTSAGTGWIQVVEDPATFVVGTDNIDVFQFSGSGTITAGTNVSVSGNAVSVVAAPTFSGLVTASASGVAFSDGTQTKQGVPSITPIIQKTDSYTLASLTERDTLVEINKSSATTLTIPTNASVAFPVGTSIDILQTGTGQVTIAGAGGVTVNATPGLKLRTQWSSATLFKRATDTWVVYGDLLA